MCDKKYMDEDTGLEKINQFLEDKMTPLELDITKQIITTMSYSKVKTNGYPELNEYQMAYHIVREADLLSAYDFDRCMFYNIHVQKKLIQQIPSTSGASRSGSVGETLEHGCESLEQKCSGRNKTAKQEDDVSSVNIDIMNAFDNACELFQKRVLKHNEDGLFITEYSMHKSMELHVGAMHRINAWTQIMKTPFGTLS